jgi:threonine synthase
MSTEFVSHLECSVCGQAHDPSRAHNLCACGGPLLVRYHLGRLRQAWRRETLVSARADMWRYAPVLPVSQPHITSLGEGWTPLIAAKRLGRELGLSNLWIKDDGVNPTGSFKARGLACAVSKAKEFGITDIVMPSAGNAGGALAAYAAAAGVRAHLFMPRDVPQANFLESVAAGAEVTLVNGLIHDCGRWAAEMAKQRGWFEMSTLKEPYRIEGKKTMGYEIAEQMNWRLPDAILYPAGGGVGLIGMWKAFDEMEQLGWIGPQRPKLIAVQAEGCQPIVSAYERGQEAASLWENASTVASGLRVPKPLGDRLMLRAIRATGGCAIAVTDQELLDGALQMSACEGVYAAPEGGACVPAVRRLLQSGFLKPDDTILLYNTGSGLKYPEAFSTRFPRLLAEEADKLGGLITPR